MNKKDFKRTQKFLLILKESKKVLRVQMISSESKRIKKIGKNYKRRKKNPKDSKRDLTELLLAANTIKKVLGNIEESKIKRRLWCLST